MDYQTEVIYAVSSIERKTTGYVVYNAPGDFGYYFADVYPADFPITPGTIITLGMGYGRAATAIRGIFWTQGLGAAPAAEQR